MDADDIAEPSTPGFAFHSLLWKHREHAAHPRSMSGFIAEPRISRDGNEIVFVSQIRFRMHPASKDLAEQLLAKNEMHHYDELESRSQLVWWPLSTDVGIIQLTDRVPVADSNDADFAHRMTLEAHAKGLEEVAGFSEIVRSSDFASSDHLRSS